MWDSAERCQQMQGLGEASYAYATSSGASILAGTPKLVNLAIYSLPPYLQL
jgi:hypothetical protein